MRAKVFTTTVDINNQDIQKALFLHVKSKVLFIFLLEKTYFL